MTEADISKADLLSACQEKVRKMRKEAKVQNIDSEAKKVCPHSDFVGDLIRGPCICSDCGILIVG